MSIHAKGQGEEIITTDALLIPYHHPTITWTLPSPSYGDSTQANLLKEQFRNHDLTLEKQNTSTGCTGISNFIPIKNYILVSMSTLFKDISAENI